MEKKQERPDRTPDDFMVVTLSLDFQAKLNPKADNPQPFETTGLQYSMPASEAVDYLEAVVRAAREKRLYAFMIQDSAECAVRAGEWIEKTVEEILAEEKVQREAKD
jgi:hypothetical protein